MRVTLSLDDEPVATAQDVTGLTDMSLLVRQALEALIHRQAARRMMELGGTQPDLKAAPRRRSKPA